MHTVSHAYATHLLEEGVNIRVIHCYTGHKNLETTMRDIFLIYGRGYLETFDARIEYLMPVDHFMITCTVPAAFRDFFRSHQRFAYPALFAATSSSMLTLAFETTYFPGGAFCSSDSSWHSRPHAFYLPVRIMSAKIKSRFFKLMHSKAGLQHLMAADAWRKDWNVNSQPVGNGARSIRYLAVRVHSAQNYRDRRRIYIIDISVLRRSFVDTSVLQLPRWSSYTPSPLSRREFLPRPVESPPTAHHGIPLNRLRLVSSDQRIHTDSPRIAAHFPYTTSRDQIRAS